MLLGLCGVVAAAAALSPSSRPPDRRPAERVATPEPAAAPTTRAAGWVQATLEADSGDIADTPAEAESAGTSVAGRVLEQLDVAKYSYLRLAPPSGPAIWTAVPSTSSRLGQTVTVANAERMLDFTSPSLSRTFDEIYFGVLDSELNRVEQPMPALSARTHRADTVSDAPHPGSGRDVEAVPVHKSEKAPGPLGHTVAEIHALGAGAAGSAVRVRATIVKATYGVLGHIFLHLRDSTGTPPLDNDLTATSDDDQLALGSEVLLEGKLEVDRDFGSGYRYPVLLADAHRVTP